MKYLLILILVISSCAVDVQQRAVNVNTGVSCIVTIPAKYKRFYSTGDTVWVQILSMRVCNNTWSMNDTTPLEQGYILCALK